MIISKQRAIEMLHRLISVEVLSVKQVNTARGITKKTQREEQAAITELFGALTGGQWPSGEEIQEIIGM